MVEGNSLLFGNFSYDVGRFQSFWTHVYVVFTIPHTNTHTEKKPHAGAKAYSHIDAQTSTSTEHTKC